MIVRRLAPVLTGILVVVMSLWSIAGLRAADEGGRPVELKPLDRWIGEWDMETAVKPNEFHPQGSKSTFTATMKWTVNGRVLHCEANGSGVSGERKYKDAFTWTATYDPQLKAYTSVVCWANAGTGRDLWGISDRATGQWDDKAKTLTLKSVERDSRATMTSVTTWIDNDNHSFVSTQTDGNGKVVMEMTGKATRKK